MRKRNNLVFAIILVIFALAVSVIVPGALYGDRDFSMGLDLVGGVQLVYEVEYTDNSTDAERADAIDRALQIITDRIDKYGVTEPTIQQLEIGGKDCISVKLPNVTDIEAAKTLVKQTGYLEFRMVELDSEGDAVYLGDYIARDEDGFIGAADDVDRVFAEAWYEEGVPAAIYTRNNEGEYVFQDKNGDIVSREDLEDLATSGNIRSWIPARNAGGVVLTGSYLTSATPVSNQQAGVTTALSVAIEWDSFGAGLFNDIAAIIYSAGSQGDPERDLGIFLDNELISSPQILQPSYDNGRGQIDGNFSVDEAITFAHLLESGALPMPLGDNPLYQDNISATRGNIYQDMAIKAGIIGILLVIGFMIAYYRVSGVLASLSLAFYGALVLALFKMIPVTLSLAGLGGFILSIGMAVDANVLIFERMKEELRAGKTLGSAIEAGFNRAWPAIRDGNITTLIVCVILYWVGGHVIAGEPVMGFALTLGIGVAVSMFSAIVGTRTLLRMFVRTEMAKRISLFAPFAGRK